MNISKMLNGLQELADVLNEEYDRIDTKSERKKREVNYIIHLVRKNFDKLVKVSGTENKRELYDFVKEALLQTEKVYSPLDLAILHREPNKKACLLGWIDGGIEVSEFNALKSSPYTRLTDLGRKVVGDYREFKKSL